MKKVLVFSDSLALPRDYPETCNYEDCWPQLLNTEYQVHQVSIGGATISELAAQIPYTKMFQPDILILQSGIVDCAPRALKKSEQRFLDKLPFFGYRILQRVQKRKVKLRKRRKITYSSPVTFEESAQRIREAFPNAKIFAFGVVSANDAYEASVPGIKANVQRYNGILHKVFGEHYIDITELPEDGVMSDNIHLNDKGHAYLHQMLIEQL